MSKRTFVSLAFCLAGIFALYGQEENQNNYGVDEANTKFGLQSGVLGGETNYTYLSLKDHEDVSGVPLGGYWSRQYKFRSKWQIHQDRNE